MIPGWKIKREILRLGQQIAWYWETAFAKKRTQLHDLNRPRLVKRHDGARVGSNRIAAILVFQPANIPQSLTDTCDQLTSLGYAVLIVSNGPLQPEACAALQLRVWRVLERPNFGYDFGGYREAVMHIWDEGIDPEELLIMNDSVWVLPEYFNRFIERQRLLQVDVSGAIIRSKEGKSWIESYFYRISRPALESNAFRRFWRDYRLINSKYAVIRQGERNFSVAMSSGGLRIAALADNAEFTRQLESATTNQLRLALIYSASVTGPHQLARNAIIAMGETPDWREQAVAHIAASLDDGRVWNSQFPIAGHLILGYPFIKKSREPVNAEWRRLVIEAIDDGILPPVSPSIRLEMEARQAAGATNAPHWLTARTRGA